MKNELKADELNYVIYCRKSTEDEDKQVQSLETQLRELNEHAIKNGLKIIETITESQSAHTTGRPGFQKMLKLIKTEKANALLVIRANRISRNAFDAAEIITLLDQKKLIYIRTPSSTCYTGSSTNKMMLGLELIFSKKDSDDKSDMVKEGFRTKYLKGTPGGVAPIGFKNTPHLDRGARHWLVDEEKFTKVQHLFQLFLKGGYSGSKLAEYAKSELKLTTPQHKRLGGKPVERSYIFTMLKNSVYAGFFISDGVRYELDKKLPRIITEKQHEQIKRMLGSKHKSKFQKHENPFEGFLKGDDDGFMRLDTKHQLICDCGHKFAYRKKDCCPRCNLKIPKMVKAKYLHYNYYYNGLKRYKNEPFSHVKEEKIVEVINTEISQPLSLSPLLTDWVKKYIHEIKDVEVNEKLELEESRIKVIENIENEKAELRSQNRRGIISDEEYKLDLERLLKRIPEQQESEVDWRSKLNEIVDLGQEFKNILENGNIKAKKEIFFALESNLIWDEKNLYLIKPKWLDAYISGINKLKQKIGTVEPKILENKPLETVSFSSIGVEKYSECKFLLRELESNQCLQVMSLPRYHFSIPQCFLKAHTNCDF